MASSKAAVFIGTAGWSVPRAVSGKFPAEGSHLERYAQVYNAVEINSSFYRPHRPATYERWAASVPRGFRFAVKMPKTITHDLRLQAATRPLVKFLGEVQALGAKLGPVLIQLPPSLVFDEKIAGQFFTLLRRHHAGAAACEPRHASWFEAAVAPLLVEHRIARVAADPACVPAAAQPGGWSGLAYRRLHGSPRMYWSSYPKKFLRGLAAQIQTSRVAQSWCVFDNTASGAAAENALALKKLAGI